MKKICLIFLFIICINIPCYSSELSDDYFDIAQNYIELGDTTKALEYTNYVLMINPNDQRAVKLKDLLIPQETNDDLSRSAIIMSKEKSLADLAILDIPKSDRYKIENTSEYYNKQGKQYYLNKEYDNAIKCFFRAISIDDKNYIAYNNLGMTYWMKNNLISAEKYFKKAASTSKYYPQPYINLALLYKQKGDMEKHFSFLKKALEVNPDNHWTHYLIGDYYSNTGNYPASIDYYIDAIDINPNFSPSYLALGIAYFNTDKYDQSIIALKKYIELNPKSDFAYSVLAKNYYLKGDYQNAKIYMLKALKLNSSITYRMELAKILFNNEEYNEALLNFQIIEPEYQYAELYNYIGLCNLMLKKFEPAVTNFNKAIVADNHRPIYYYNLAQAYDSLGDKRKYVQYMNLAIQISPLTYQDYIDLSCIYYNTSKTSAAIKILENGIETYPDAKPLYMALMGLYDSIDDNISYNNIKNTIESRFNTYDKKKTFKLFR